MLVKKAIRIKQCPQAPASCHPDGWPAGRKKLTSRLQAHSMGIYKKGKNENKKNNN